MNTPTTNGRGEATHNGGGAHEVKYREDIAGYVAAMLAELRQMAGKAGLDRLVATLDAAYYDAYAALDGKGRDAAPPSPGANPASPSSASATTPPPFPTCAKRSRRPPRSGSPAAFCSPPPRSARPTSAA